MQIKQFEISEKDALLEFLRFAYSDNPRQSDAGFWDWHFLQNPYVEPDNLPIWVVKDAAKIVGQLGAIPVRLKVGGEIKNAIWILDMIVHPDYRRRGLAQKLVLAAEEFCPLGLGVNTSEQNAPALLQKLGWKIVSKIPRFHKILFPGEALREISRHKALRLFANAVSAPWRPRASADFFKNHPNLRIVPTFDDSFDNLWRESANQWSCAVAREPAILDWQYRRQPNKKFDIIGFYEDGELLGYVVLFFRRTDEHGALAKAAVTDLCYHPSKPIEIVDELLRASLQIALERRAGGLVTDALDDLIESRLNFHKFWRVKNPLQLMVKSEENRNLLYDASRWFLTRGDSDTSIFERPNL